MSSNSYQGSDNFGVVFGVIGGVSVFAILLCWIAACRRMADRSTDAPDGSQTSQAAQAAVNGGTAVKDGDSIIDVTEPAVAVIELAVEIQGGGSGGGGGGGGSVGCCCGGGGCGDGGGCGGCGGD